MMYVIRVTGDGKPYYLEEEYEYMDEAWLVAADVEATFDFISCQVEKKD